MALGVAVGKHFPRAKTPPGAGQESSQNGFFWAFVTKSVLESRYQLAPTPSLPPDEAASSFPSFPSVLLLCPADGCGQRTEGNEGNEGSKTRIVPEIYDLEVQEEFCLTPNAAAEAAVPQGRYWAVSVARPTFVMSACWSRSRTLMTFW